jgi:hypothetical protein
LFIIKNQRKILNLLLYIYKLFLREKMNFYHKKKFLKKKEKKKILIIKFKNYSLFTNKIFNEKMIYLEYFNLIIFHKL